jgi:hypothetical protein
VNETGYGALSMMAGREHYPFVAKMNLGVDLRRNPLITF